MNAIVHFPVTPEARPYLDAFERGVGPDANAEPAWLARIRRRGIARFAATCFPTRQSESWRYLDLQKLRQQPLLPAKAPSGAVLRRMGERLAHLALPETGARLVLADGRFAGELSSTDVPEGVWFGPTCSAVAERPDLANELIGDIAGDAAHPFAALNAALFGDGYILAIAPGVSLDQPIEIVHLGSGAGTGSFHTRSRHAGPAGASISRAMPARKPHRALLGMTSFRPARRRRRADPHIVVEESARRTPGALDVTLGPGGFTGFALVSAGGRCGRRRMSMVARMRAAGSTAPLSSPAPMK